jgi:DNA-binding NtrC family response regulator
VLTLAGHFLHRFRAKYGKPVERIDPRARDRLLAYPWPGNVRELSHVIERAVLWSRGPVIDVEHLALEAPAEPAPREEEPAATAPTRPAGMDLEQWERTLIEQALRESDGNQTRAAQRLGISRDTLRYRLKKYGMQS